MKPNDSVSKEDLLIGNLSIDELIKKKMEEEIKNEIINSKKGLQNTKISNIADVPKELIFSKTSVFKVFNRTTKQVSYINGLQADSLLGLQNNLRLKIQNGKADAFSTENSYVKFEKVILKK